MQTYISLLRGINVGGHKKIKMDALQSLYEALEFTNVKTFIQSGNVVFQSSITNVSELTKKIESEIMKVFGFEVPIVIRTKDEMKSIIENNPLKEDIGTLFVAFLSDRPIDIPLAEINKGKDDSEKFIIAGKEIYLSYPNGFAHTKLTNNLFEKKLKVVATVRNWNTVNKLYEMAKAMEQV